MKLLLIDNSPAMGGSIRDGAPLANELTGAGVHVGVIASRPDLFAPLLLPEVERVDFPDAAFRNVFASELGLTGSRFPIIGQSLAMFRFHRRLAPLIGRTFASFSPDVVHLNNLNLPHRPFAHEAKERGIPLVVSVQMIRFFARSEADIAVGADRVICISHATRDCLAAQARLDPTRLRVVPAGIDPAPFARCAGSGWRERVGLPRDAPVACLVGRLTDWKGQHVAIAAWRKVVEAIPAARLVIVGGGDDGYLADCRSLASRLGLSDAVVFAGHRDDIADALDASNLLIHASCYSQPSDGTVEAFGLIVVEAMAAGLPVVATAAGGPCEIVEDGVTGRLVAPNDPDAIAAAAIGYLTDRNAARSAGDAGRQRANEQFTVARMAEATLQIYRELVQ